ncbi:MAG: hypothetical protein B9J98_06740 [Candidatus Terraquivivens tikiterensis]|uniref:Uncharacterized protein n=1 Tax=Candidatus Terraquivivens tikiterensis TaxID=1980982 RepID=A0A2R7Y1E4_9ARCH|nr:MAG: hypothetical protein B9J98_06740 [Candidatus Terraquivivens tikiterensis]
MLILHAEIKSIIGTLMLVLLMHPLVFPSSHEQLPFQPCIPVAERAGFFTHGDKNSLLGQRPHAQNVYKKGAQKNLEL